MFSRTIVAFTVNILPTASRSTVLYVYRQSPRSPTMARMSASFGPGNQGFQVVQNLGLINAEIHLPPGKVTMAPCEPAPLTFRSQNDGKRRRPPSHPSPSPAIPISSTVETFSTRSTSDVPSPPRAWPSWAWVVSASRSWPSSSRTGFLRGILTDGCSGFTLARRRASKRVSGLLPTLSSCLAGTSLKRIPYNLYTAGCPTNGTADGL